MANAHLAPFPPCEVCSCNLTCFHPMCPAAVSYHSAGRCEAIELATTGSASRKSIAALLGAIGGFGLRGPDPNLTHHEILLELLSQINQRFLKHQISQSSPTPLVTLFHHTELPWPYFDEEIVMETDAKAADVPSHYNNWLVGFANMDYSNPCAR